MPKFDLFVAGNLRSPKYQDVALIAENMAAVHNLIVQLKPLIEADWLEFIAAEKIRLRVSLSPFVPLALWVTSIFHQTYSDSGLFALCQIHNHNPEDPLIFHR